MKTIKLKKVLLVALVITGIASCKKQFDLLPSTELDASQTYKNVYDANSAVMGIYGKFMGLADRYIVLNELRGDLMEYTQNADENLRQVSTHTVSTDNPYANPRPFYELIIDCNDVLKNFDIMRQNKALTEDDYNQRYSDIACIRSFLYLQLGIHWGQVPYITEALENITDINDASRFPKITFNALLDSLVNFTDRIPYKELYPAPVGSAIGAYLNITLDAYPTERMFINKKCFLGELHLWKGNYRKAASYYREVMETVGLTESTGENFYHKYRIGTSDANNSVTYSRGGDASTLVYTDGWGAVFASGPTDKPFGREFIWVLPFDSRYQPANPLINLFSPIGGSYLVKPSKEAMDNWDNQEQRSVNIASSLNGIPYDARGMLTVRNVGGQPTIMKFISNYINLGTLTPTNSLAKNGKWFLFRTSHMHLHFAEAANRDGFPKLGYVLANDGLRLGAYAAPSTATNDYAKEPYQNTLFLPKPYNFDARQLDNPRYRSDWYRNIGIRGQANLKNYVLNAAPNLADSILKVENELLDDAALEVAFEGTRWSDLLRVALRRNEPAVIADRVFRKLSKDGVGNAQAVKEKLMRGEYYLPFKLQ